MSETDRPPFTDNVDYNELKVLIKENTTQNSGQARAIPGQVDPALAKFEDAFFHELSNQHDRVDLFVKDKTGAIGRNLRMDCCHSALWVMLIECRTYPEQRQCNTFAIYGCRGRNPSITENAIQAREV